MSTAFPEPKWNVAPKPYSGWEWYLSIQDDLSELFVCRWSITGPLGINGIDYRGPHVWIDTAGRVPYLSLERVEGWDGNRQLKATNAARSQVRVIAFEIRRSVRATEAWVAALGDAWEHKAQSHDAQRDRFLDDAREQEHQARKCRQLSEGLRARR